MPRSERVKGGRLTAVRKVLRPHIVVAGTEIVDFVLLEGRVVLVHLVRAFVSGQLSPIEHTAQGSHGRRVSRELGLRRHRDVGREKQMGNTRNVTE